MANPNKNLKAVIEYFGISKNEMARAIDVDPSLISRWINGERKLRASGSQMEALTEYILSHSKRIQDIEWLKTQFEASCLPTDISSVYRTKQNLIMWLASDGENLRKNLGSLSPTDITKNTKQKKSSAVANSNHSGVMLSCIDISLELEQILSGISDKSIVNVFLSNDQISTIINEDIAALLLRMIEKNDLKIQMVVCVSGVTQAMSALINTYLQTLMSGHIKLLVVHGMTQTVTNQMHLIIPGTAAMLVIETPCITAPPVAVTIRDPVFISEIQKSFDQATRYAQYVLTLYGDDFSRNILEIIYQEFCTPGPLDVVKDAVNPMYMSEEAYNHALLLQGHSDVEYKWRSEEFTRFKSGMDETLRGGSVFREILSLSRLNQIAQYGYCRMPGLYFMKRGFVHLDTNGCVAILNGYIHYLETFPNFHVLILDDISTLHTDNCWQLKQNHHLAINYWNGPEPVMIHSDQLILLREFQAHFNRLWAQGAGGIGSRVNVISILQHVIESLTQLH